MGSIFCISHAKWSDALIAGCVIPCLAWLWLTTTPAWAQGEGSTGTPTRAAPLPLPPISSLSGTQIVSHAEALCSRNMAGRAAGEAGARAASEYIRDQFKKAGLQPGGNAGSFFQTFKIRAGYRISADLHTTFNGKTIGYERKTDYMPVHMLQNEFQISAGCVMAGYGVCSDSLKFDEYAGIDVTGKVVVVFSGVPWSRETSAWLWRIENKTRDSLAYKAKTAAAHGAVMLLVVDDPSGWRSRLGYAEQLTLPDRSFPLKSPIPVVHVTRKCAARITGLGLRELRALAADIREKRKPRSTPVDGVILSYKASIKGSAAIGRNVVAVLMGSHPIRRSETVVIGAHYDHLGTMDEQIYFGANDNAAGVGALIELSKAFARLPEPPSRSIVFIAFAAEEIGKLGSNYYVEHPCLPMRNTALMINFDMIGRNEPNEIHAVATKSSRDLHELHQRMNEHVGLQLKHPDNFRLGRSDHTAFFLAGVPVMYLFGGLHADYNTIRDTPDRLIAAKLEKVARLAFLTAWEVAQREKRISFDWEAGE